MARAPTTRPARSVIWSLTVGCLAFLVLAGLCCVLLLALMGTSPAAFLVGGVLAVVLAPLYVGFLVALDPLEHEPPWLLALAFGWGAGVATLGGGLATAVLESSSGALLGLSAGARDAIGTVLFAPLMEEVAKGAFPFALFLLARHEFDDVADGIVYGGLVGLGFAVVEDLFYYAAAFLEGGLAGTGALFVIRGILTGFGHPLYTAVTGLGIGLVVQVRSPLARWLLPPGGLIGAVLLHALWNGAVTLAQAEESGALAAVVLLGYPVLVLLPGAVGLAVIAVVQARRRSRDVRHYLASAVERGLADPDDLDVLTRPWRRRARQVRTLLRYGFRAFWLRRRLDIALVDWAYRCWRRARGERLPGYLGVFEAEALEARIRQYRAALDGVISRPAR